MQRDPLATISIAAFISPDLREASVATAAPAIGSVADRIVLVVILVITLSAIDRIEPGRVQNGRHHRLLWKHRHYSILCCLR